MSEEITNQTTRDLSNEMRNSFLDYAMSVIVARALPDVRDGLKPVHRRILYGMNEVGVTPDKPYKKSARIVGDVMGKYHPHGDSAIYESMVRMAQDFSYRYELIDGHGNFGSIDGDQAAAMRYTEARMSKIAMEMVRDINKDTVDFIPNYDGEEREPEILPARFPNLIVNGATGIAVGMTTNIPPHNLSEVISALHLLMKNPDISTTELMSVLPGPDFPTGGIVMGKSGIRKAYETGRGHIVLRAKVDIDQMANGKERLLITEIPYMVNKARLVERIANLARDKRIDGITAVRDESGRDGMRIVIECRKDASASVILNNLYKETQLQTNFNFNMVAIVKGVPKLLSLKDMLRYYLDHQEEVIRRRSLFEKKKAEARVHILEGLQTALDHIDAIVEILRSSKTGDEAKQIFSERYGLSDKQSQAILDMRMVRLTGLEREKIDNEWKELRERIDYLNEVLASEEKRYQIIYEELLEIQHRFGDERRTELRVGEITSIDDEDLIEETNVLITLSHNGYIKRVDEDTFHTQNRGGRGVKGMALQDGDYIETLLSTSTHDVILCFTNKGRVYSLKGYDIPEYSRTAKGLPIINLLDLDQDEFVRATINVSGDEEAAQHEELFFVTKRGTVKRTKANEYIHIRANGLIAIKLKEDDELVSVMLTDGEQQIILGTKDGFAITFNEQDVRSIGRSATGVRGISLKAGDEVVGADRLKLDDDVFVVSENGYGKRTPMSEYSVQHRGGKGVKTANLNQKTGRLIGLKAIDQTEDVILMTNEGVVIRFHSADISQMSRSTQGVRLMRLDSESFVSAMALVALDDEDETSEETTVADGGEPTDTPTANAQAASDSGVLESPQLSDEAVADKLQDLTDQLLTEDETTPDDETEA
ncbi:MAG: DNA gyrase subunit A [Aerococcus sp.]|nr:DNA gyrase subunit A [Aerococcus sp.]